MILWNVTLNYFAAEGIGACIKFISFPFYTKCVSEAELGEDRSH